MLPRSAYNYNHWAGCMCDPGCAGIFRHHNPSAPSVISCNCNGCQKRYAEQMNVAARDAIAQTMGMEQRSMATVNICERTGCETFIKGRALGGITLVLSSDNRANPADNIIRMEICPGCVKDIHDIISVAPVSKRERSYSDPFRPEDTEVADALTGVTNEQLAAALFERMLRDPNARKSIMGGDSGS